MHFGAVIQFWRDLCAENRLNPEQSQEFLFDQLPSASGGLSRLGPAQQTEQCYSVVLRSSNNTGSDGIFR